MRYHQITSEERHTLATLRKQHRSVAEIATIMERHRSTMYRELNRNCCRYDGGYRYERAKEQASARRKRAPRNRRLTAQQLLPVEVAICKWLELPCTALGA